MKKQAKKSKTKPAKKSPKLNRKPAPDKIFEEKQIARARYFGYTDKNVKTGKKIRSVKGIKEYVSFKVDRKRMTITQARKINKYWYHIDRLLARPVTVYKSKSKANLKKAQEYAGHNLKFNEINVAFIPVTNHDVKVKVNRAGVSVQTTNIRTDHIIFDHRKLIKNPSKYIKEEIKKKAPKAKTFKIRVGHSGIYEIEKVRADRGTIAGVVIRYMNKYNGTEKNYNKPKSANKHWKNWLHGLNAYYSTNQAKLSKYFKERGIKRKTNANTRKKVRVKMEQRLNRDGFSNSKNGRIKRLKN